MCAVPDEGDRCLCVAAALQFPYGGYLSKPAIRGPSGFLFLAQFHSKPFSIIIHCAFTLNFHRTANDWGRHKCFSSTISISSELLLCIERFKHCVLLSTPTVHTVALRETTGNSPTPESTQCQFIRLLTTIEEHQAAIHSRPVATPQ